jgi:hypothetical protein
MLYSQPRGIIINNIDLIKKSVLVKPKPEKIYNRKG